MKPHTPKEQAVFCMLYAMKIPLEYKLHRDTEWFDFSKSFNDGIGSIFFRYYHFRRKPK